MDTVRTGAVLYGDSVPAHQRFRKCLRFKARVGSINPYSATTGVGYGWPGPWSGRHCWLP